MPVINGTSIPDETPGILLNYFSMLDQDDLLYRHIERLLASRKLTWVWRMFAAAKTKAHLHGWQHEERLRILVDLVAIDAHFALDLDEMKGRAVNAQRLRKIERMARQLLDEVPNDTFAKCLMQNGAFDEDDHEFIRNLEVDLTAMLDRLATGAMRASNQDIRTQPGCISRRKMRKFDQANSKSIFLALGIKQIIFYRWQLEDLNKPWKAMEDILEVILEGTDVELLDAEAIRKLGPG